jgi:GntR family transcriptional regulator, transcriptional repressor for pyruvate dehydrogenase complex
MSELFERIPQRHTASDIIIDQFTKMIKEGKLNINDKIPSERDLSEQFGVGRSTVREALKSMNSMGLLESRPGEGTFIRKVDSDSIKQQLQWSFYLDPAPVTELFQLRMLLELKMVEMAALNREEEHLLEMEQWIHSMKDDSESIKNKKNDLMFHMTIASASGNKLMYNLLDLIRLSLEEWFELVLTEPVNVINSIDEHILILDAIREKNPTMAMYHLQTHLESGEKRLLDIYSSIKK